MSQNDGPLQHILQLTNVPRPVIPREGFHRGCRNVVDCPAHPLRMFLNEVAREQRYVFAALPERRYAQRKDVEPVVQVGAKFVFVHHRFRSRFVAATKRTSVRIVRVPPTRSNSWSWMARSSFGWSSSGISPISSRNNVPL